MDLSILLKDNKLDMEGCIISLLKVIEMRGCLIEKYVSREAFGFARVVIGLTRRPTIVNKLDVIVLQQIINTLFVSIGIFYLIVPYLSAVLFVTMMNA